MKFTTAAGHQNWNGRPRVYDVIRHGRPTVFSMLSCLNRGRVGECTLVLKMRHLTFRTEWTCCTTASPKWYRCLGWPSGVCAVFWGKMPSSSAEKSRLYRFPEIQTWCLILVQISLARADLQNDRPKQTVTGALMLPKRAAHAVHTTSDGAVHTRRDACSAAGCVRAAHEK